jgi:pimeloyl-ACP methyl ester carboxylesterase
MGPNGELRNGAEAMKCGPRALRLISLFALFLSIVGSNPAFAAPTSTGSRGDSDAPHYEERLCPVAGPVGETEGETYFCGVVHVPENYDDPDGRRLQLTFTVLKSTSLSPLPDPVVYLEGGPGGSEVDWMQEWAERFAELRQTRDIVLFDQRGTKFSSRLDCGPHLFFVNYLMQNDPDVAAQYQQIAEADDDTLLDAAMMEISMSACVQGLEDVGIDLSQYTSANTVKDLFAIVDALGYDEINLYGISYGTRVAMTVMRDHPDRVRSVVLDSAYPTQLNYHEHVYDLAEEAVENLVSDCENDPECNEAFPNFRAELKELLATYDGDPDAMQAFGSVLEYMNYQPAVAAYFPLMVHQMLSGDKTVLKAMFDGTLPLEDAPENRPGLQDDVLLRAEMLRQQAEQLFARAAEEAQQNRPGAQWMRDLNAVMDGLSVDDRSLAAYAMMVVPQISPDPSRDRLIKFVQTYLPADEQEALIAGLNDLPDAELQYIYDLIETSVDDITGEDVLSFGSFYSVLCNEEYWFNDLDVAAEARDNLEFPELAYYGDVILEQHGGACKAWPREKLDPRENEVVTSDIPTLILSGDYDWQTSPSWNDMAAEGLSNATVVHVPASGHGTLIFSQCATDIGATFIASPDTDVNTACTADLHTDFVTEDELVIPDSGDSTSNS